MDTQQEASSTLGSDVSAPDVHQQVHGAEPPAASLSSTDVDSTLSRQTSGTDLANPRRVSGPGRPLLRRDRVRAPAADPAPLVSGPLLRHNKTIFAYGNYDQYYRHRHDRCATIDPRIEALLKKFGSSFFTGKTVLDMGCNSGFVTLLTAALGARHVEGVDIDLLLVSKALKQLRHLKHLGATTMPELEGSSSSSSSAYPMSCVQSRGIVPYHSKPLAAGSLQAIRSLPETLPDNGSSAFGGRIDEPPSHGLPFPHNVEFRTENLLVSEVEERRGQPYDIILCLKLTKWVHLHWGDDGLQVLLHKCHRLLRPGGILVLEAQDWSSYLPKKHLTPHMRQNRCLLQLRPQDLPSYLVREVGFERLATVDSPQLKRPLYLFKRVKVLTGRGSFGQGGYQSIAEQVSAVAAAASATAAASMQGGDAFGTSLRPLMAGSLIAQTASIAAAMASAALSSDRMSPPRMSPVTADCPTMISPAGYQIPPPPPPVKVPVHTETESEGPESKRQRTDL